MNGFDHALCLGIDALEDADSYRKFNVTATGIYVPEYGDEGKLIMITRANEKPNFHCRKRCAELKVMQLASEAKRRLQALVVIGTPQRDDDSLVLSATLHPCRVCRRAMWYYYFEELQVISDETRIITVRPDFSVIENQTLLQLLKIHGEDY